MKSYIRLENTVNEGNVKKELCHSSLFGDVIEASCIGIVVPIRHSAFDIQSKSWTVACNMDGKKTNLETQSPRLLFAPTHLVHWIDGQYDEDVHNIMRVQIIVHAPREPLFRDMHRTDGTSSYRDSVLKWEVSLKFTHKELITQIIRHLHCINK